jgi:hypothetical protein
MYDTKVVIPTEIECLSYKVLYFFANANINDKELRANLELVKQLDSI